MPIDAITDTTFDATLRAARTPVLVDFWAPWCGPCAQIAPHLDAIAAARADLRVVKMNVDDNPATPARLNIRGLPSLVLFRDGAVAGLLAGAMTRSRIEAWIDDTLG